MPHPAVLNPDTVRLATHRALAARDRLVQDYPHWETWRRRARDLKRRVLADWETNLASLRDAVMAWGGHVLWARDAAEARGHILAVARRHGVSSVVKSKSMTTEEIGLNPALTAAGIAVTETDLGEFIVQLAGQPPAHLTAPALHLNRLDIARLFARHLGYALPAEPEALCSAAGRHLAPRFDAAQLGLTGVNFAAADGTLVFLENEGNLRRSACSPPVHLAVMGLEKLIPRVEDLEVFLRLLPASATGQRLTALVHLLRGLKTGPWGRQAFYLVLLDNGRRRLGRDPDFREALFCLRCGACLNICPVFQAGGAHLYGRVYPGAIGILLAPFLPPLGDIADLCTQCGACGDFCPVAIPLPELILKLRQGSGRFRPGRGLAALASQVLTRPGLYRRGAALLRRLAPAALGRRGEKVLGQPPAPASFHALAQSRPELQGGSRGKMGKPAPPFFPNGAGQAPPAAEKQFRSEPASLPPGDRFTEAGGSFQHLAGPQALAAFLAARVSGRVRLQDHPWLAPVATELQARGIEAGPVGGQEWGPAADTVVSVGLAAVPETGSVLVAPPEGPAAWLPFRACRQVVVVPAASCGLSPAQALALAGRRPEPLVSWLTGPTRTADIEKILVLGAQGPAALDVVAYEPS